MTKDKGQRTKDELIWLFFAFIIIAVYFFALGNFPLTGPDESRYAQVAREMFERGDWITPTLGGFDWFEKPVLLYWLQIASYKIFGVSEYAARFGAAIFGLGTIVSLYLLGRFTTKTQGHKEKENSESEIRNLESPKTEDQKPKTDLANWLALIAASSIGLLVFSRGASFDIILTFPITASLVSFFIFDQSKKKSLFTFYFSLFTFYFFIGVALLAKGLVGIVFPFAIVALYFLLSRKLPDKTFIFSLFWGTILSLLVASVWYLPMYLTNGWKFIDEFFIQHHFQRYTSDKYEHLQPFWFFWFVLPLMTIPWLPFFLASIWNFFRKIFQHKNTKEEKGKRQKEKGKIIFSFFLLPFSLEKPLLLFSLSWLLVPLVFFSLSGSKLPGYILPALPAALILTAEYVCRFIENRPKRKHALQFLAFLTFAVVAFILQFVAPKYAEGSSVRSLIEAADAGGYADRKIINLYVAWHNAEFYAAGRLVRDSDGRLKHYDAFSDLVLDLKSEGAADILVLVPVHALKNVTETELVEAKVLGESGKAALVLIKPNI